MTGSDTSDGGGGGGFPGGGGVDMNDLFANIFAQAAAAQHGQRRGFGGGQPFVFTSGFPGSSRGFQGFPGGGMHGGIDLDEIFRGMGAGVPRQRSTRSPQNSSSSSNSNSRNDENVEPDDPVSSLIRNPYVQRIISIVKDVPPMILMPVAIFLVIQFGSLVMGFIYRKIYIMCILMTFNPLKKYTLSILPGLFVLDALGIL